MALRTAFTEMLGLRHPVALASMGGSQAIDLITDLPRAAEVVGRLAAEAEEALTQALGR